MNQRTLTGIAIVVVAGLALAGCGGGASETVTVAAEPATVTAPAEETGALGESAQASPEIVAMLEDRLAALNAGDAAAIAEYFTPNAVLNDVASGTPSAPFTPITGNEEIGRYIAQLANFYGMQLEQVPPILQYGRTVVEPVKVPGEEDLLALLVYRIAQDGRISYEWVLPAGMEFPEFG